MKQILLSLFLVLSICLATASCANMSGNANESEGNDKPIQAQGVQEKTEQNTLSEENSDAEQNNTYDDKNEDDPEFTDEYFVEKYSIYKNPIDEYYWPKIYSWDASQVEIREAQDAYRKVWKAEFKNLMKWLRKKCIYDEDKKNIQKLEKNVARQIKIERKVCETEMADAYEVNPDSSKVKDSITRFGLPGNGTHSKLNQIEGEIYRDTSMRIIHLYGGVGEEEYEFRKVDYATVQ